MYHLTPHALEPLSVCPLPYEPSILAEKEVIRLLHQLARPIRPVDVKKHFAINHRTAVRLLHSLLTKGWLTPISRTAGVKIIQYELTRGVMDFVD